MSSPPVFARKRGVFLVTQFKFCATARNRKSCRKKIGVARVYNVASRFPVCFEQSIRISWLIFREEFDNATPLRRWWMF